MESNSEEELRKELESTQNRLRREQIDRETEKDKAEYKAVAREKKASENTASIVFFGAIAVILVLALFGVTGD